MLTPISDGMKILDSESSYNKRLISKMVHIYKKTKAGLK